MANPPVGESWQAMPQPAPPAAQQNNPMAGHVKAVAVINLVFSGLTALVSLFMIFGLGVGMAAVDSTEQYGTPSWVANMLGALALLFGVIGVAIALLYGFAGVKLLGFQRSGKGLGVASAILQIIVGLPTIFGAGIGLLILGAGIYGLVILLNRNTDALLTG